MPQNLSNKEEINLDESLDSLLSNLNHNYIINPDITSVNIKSKLRSRFFGTYPERLNNFRTTLVKTLNKFQKILHYQKISLEDDYQIKLNAIKKELSLTFEDKFKALELNLDNKSRQIQHLEAELLSLGSIIKGLESILSSSFISSKNYPATEENKLENSQSIDLNYLLLENRYRGSEELIKNRLQAYLEVIKKNIEDKLLLSKPFIEIGSGRGEFLEILKLNNITSLGLEPDSGMYEYSKSKGLDVVKSDVLSYLNTLEDNSISGVTAFQVIEHLPLDYFKKLLSELKRTIIKDGIVIFETINTAQVLPLCNNYFRDPTHQPPMHPDTVKFIIENSGLKVIDTIYSSSYPKEVILQKIQEQEEFPFRYKELVSQINERINSLNTILYGDQDYAVVAKNI